MDNTMTRYTMKVNRVLNVVVWLGFAALILLYFLGITSFIPFTVAFIGACISTWLIYKNTAVEIIPYTMVFPLFILIAVLMTDLPASAAVVAAVEVVLVALYLNKRWLVINSTAMSLVLIYVLLFIGHLSSQMKIMSILPFLFLVIGICLLTIWGSELIVASQKKEQEANQLLDEINETMNVIKNGTSSLNADIDNCNNNLAIVHTISESISAAIQDIAKGIVEQSSSLANMNEKMKQGGQEVSAIKDNSNMLVEVASEASKVVTEGAKRIEQMDRQMGIINQTVNNSFSTVQELNANMDEVNDFLSGIAEIAGQTNLLALNAAIEAARAGESGKGFAVVADEVRKLAEQSAETVKRISGIIERIKAKATDILDQSQRGSAATSEGEAIVKQVTETFARVQISFKDIDAYVLDELKKIEKTAAVFMEIIRETDNIASISEQHSAATEEVTATTEEHNASIETIYNLMKDIKNSSDRLESLAK
ncbi:MAG: methyl-accepting chemotaxis protein [Ignavibacteriales bacterium]